MVKRKIGPRINPLVWEKFQEVYKKEGLSLGEAVEALMALANDFGIHDLKIMAESSREQTRQMNKLALESEIVKLETCMREDQPKRDAGEHICGVYGRKDSIGKIINLIRLISDPDLTRRAEQLILLAAEFYATQ